MRATHGPRSQPHHREKRLFELEDAIDQVSDRLVIRVVYSEFDQLVAQSYGEVGHASQVEALELIEHCVETAQAIAEVIAEIIAEVSGGAPHSPQGSAGRTRYRARDSELLDKDLHTVPLARAGRSGRVAPWTRYPTATTEDLAEMTPNWVRTDLMSAIADGHRDADPAAAFGDSDRGTIGEPEPRPRVLLVEDDGVIAHMYELGLTIGGYPVRLASSGESALTEASKDSPPDVVILDLELPAMSGLQMLEELRHRPATLHVPVIVLSNSDVDFSEAYRRGATQCHSKYRTTPQALVDYRAWINGRSGSSSLNRRSMRPVCSSSASSRSGSCLEWKGSSPV
ncbi:MAG: response regulator [Chloroflexi bacterium]|nr:MAG: response regulator [Chloroflexota bacterium]